MHCRGSRSFISLIEVDFSGLMFLLKLSESRSSNLDILKRRASEYMWKGDCNIMSTFSKTLNQIQISATNAFKILKLLVKSLTVLLQVADYSCESNEN